MTDRLIFTPRDVDLARSPLAGKVAAETYVLGAFNPGFTRLPNGNLLLMVRVAEALRHAVENGRIRSIRWADGKFVLDSWPLDAVDTSDPRTFAMRAPPKAMALTSLSWLLPVELDPAGESIIAVHYDRAIAPSDDNHCYGIEDPRISRVGDRYWMTVCSVSAQRLGTTLYTSSDALDWRCEGLVLDHQNKDMLIFEGQIDGRFWAQTRPLGDVWFAYPPDSPHRPGPAINLATSPDGLHWKPHDRPCIRPSATNPATARMGGGAPPLLTSRGWLSLWHGVEPNHSVGTYRTYWAMLDADDPAIVIDQGDAPLIEPAPALTVPIGDLMYLDDIVFTTGLVDGGDHFLVASGEADLACRLTRIDKRTVGL